MIIATKGDQFHRLKSEDWLGQIIRHDVGHKIEKWMIDDALDDHHDLFGWHIVRVSEQESDEIWQQRKMEQKGI